MFTGCGTALVTPFRRDFTLDEAALRRQVELATLERLGNSQALEALL